MKMFGERPSTCPSGYRPSGNISVPVTWTNGSTGYYGWVQVMTDGSIILRYIKDDHTIAEPTSAFKPYGGASWTV